MIDLGVDTSAEKFIAALEENPGSHIGISALLTTTMVNMRTINKDIKEKFPETRVFVGGAPLSQDFSDDIGADGYFPDPHSFAKHLSENFAG